MAKRQKKSSLQKEYQKARKNAKVRYNRALTKGLALDFQFPAVPKRITQGSINRLNKINANYISKHSESLIEEDAVMDSDVIIQNTYAEMAIIDDVLSLAGEYSDLGGARLVIDWLNEVEAAVGKEVLANALQNDARYGGTFAPFEFYDKNGDYMLEHLAYLDTLVQNISEQTNYQSSQVSRIREWLEDI